MYQFKKFHEGIAVIDDDTGESRLISPREFSILLKRYPGFRSDKVASWFVDTLPEGIRHPKEKK